MAAELKELDPQQKVTLVHSRDRLLSAEPLPDEFAERVATQLKEQGVEVILGQRVIDTAAVEEEQGKRTWNMTLANGTILKAGHVMNAVSKSSPTSSYLPKDALTEEGYVKILPKYVASYHLFLDPDGLWKLTLQQSAIRQPGP